MNDITALATLKQINKLVSTQLFHLNKENISPDKIEKLLSEIKQSEVVEEVHASKTISPKLVAFIKYQLDIHNIDYINKNIKRLDSLFKNLQKPDEFYLHAFKTFFF